jgi:hypothetical protein
VTSLPRRLVGLPAIGSALSGGSLCLAFHALAQGLHQIDDIRAILFFFRRLDCLASGLAFDELAQCQLILVLELSRIEVASFGVKDMRRETDHLLCHAVGVNALEELFLVTHFIIETKGGSEHPLAPGFDGKNVLSVGEDDPCQRHAAFVLHGVADNAVGFLAALAIRHYVIRPLVVTLVDFLFGHELVDFDGVRVLVLDGLDLLSLDFDEFALSQLVTPPFVRLFHYPARFFVHHLLAKAVTRPPIDLVEASLLRLTGGRIEGNRADDEGELEIAFPIRTRWHDALRKENLATSKWAILFRFPRMERLPAAYR